MNKAFLIGNLTRDPEMRTGIFAVRDIVVFVQGAEAGDKQNRQQKRRDYFPLCKRFFHDIGCLLLRRYWRIESGLPQIIVGDSLRSASHIGKSVLYPYN